MAIVRANPNAYESGEVYLNALQDETSKNFTLLLGLLSSYWKSNSDGPFYARSLKAIAIALAQVRLNLDQIFNDTEYALTRGEFLNQVVKSLVFPEGQSLELSYSDVEFRELYVELIKIYFKGSIPESIEKAVELVTGKDVILHINYEDARKPGSGLDISDQFGFSVDIALNSPSEINTILADRNIRVLLHIIRPAHTLYTVRYILNDEYLGNNALPYIGPRKPKKIMDSQEFSIFNYKYEDYRKFALGVYGVDENGFKKSYSILGEDHSSSF